MSNALLTDELAAPLDGVTTASVVINSGSGNLRIDQLTDSEQLLASGTLEYFEKQGKPNHSLISEHGEARLTLEGASTGQPWFRFPWDVCNGATQWQIHLNRLVSDIHAHTGGGNIDVVLPEHAANLAVAASTGGGNVSLEIGSETTGINTIEASSGAGNVVVKVPHGLAAKVHARSGLGKIIVESSFSRMDAHTYQSADYEAASDKVEITVNSGAGNVSVNTIQ